MLRADNSPIRQHADRLGLPVCDALLRALREITPPGEPVPTVLAVCPNSEAVVKAAVLASREAGAPLCFAATLNQVDLDGGYTGWTQEGFVRLVRELVEETGYTGPVVVGLDHGGPWLKDLQAREGWSLERAMEGVKDSLVACLDAGYDLLHVDPTVDRTLPAGTAMPIALVIERTLELIAHAEAHRRAQGLPPVSYEVGTEEVHGGLADLSVFTRFLEGLKQGLAERGLSDVWPCFVVGKVGTDLHTTLFDPEVARELVARAAEYGSVIKGHYTDYVSNPGDYPRAGMGGANVGPEFTEAEYGALEELVRREEALVAQGKVAQASGKMAALRGAVVASGRWEKWRQPEEVGLAFDQLSAERQGWLVRTGCRYIWSDPRVVAARQRLYANLDAAGEESEGVVLRAIGEAIRKYYREFGVEGVNGRVGEAMARRPETDMPVLHHKVFAYITHGNRLLVFSHTHFPEAGIQVPAGTLNDGEDPEEGVLREAWEETGLPSLQLLGFLGECDFPALDLDQLHRRRFYHLTCGDDPPATWQHWESHPSDGSEGPILFDFFWAELPEGIPPLAPGHGAMLEELVKGQKM